MTTRAKACVGYWAAHYINRDGGWSVACDALGRIIRCNTKKLALSVARYRHRRLQPLRGGSANLANTKMRHGKDVRVSVTAFSTNMPRAQQGCLALSAEGPGMAIQKARAAPTNEPARN
jgi:hypothetical protein